MIQYIYFVKCPNCEDEHFDFFDDAKAFAMGCLSQKPIITQIEVDRNDFGECTDSADLGTVWSWEDIVGRETDAEPTVSVFTKDDLKNLPVDNDPEFEDDDSDFRFINEELLESRRISFNNTEDQKEFFKLCSETGMITAADLDQFMKDKNADDSNLLDKLRDYKAEIDSWDLEECTERKPIPEGMTIEELVEEMEENEDTVECTWCEELFDKSECRYEVNLGWLCSRCEMAIKSRGETLTFREGNYWDFLDESATKAGWRKAGPKLFKLSTDKGTAEVYKPVAKDYFELTVRDNNGKYLVGGTAGGDEYHDTKEAAMKTAEKFLLEDCTTEELQEATTQSWKDAESFFANWY